MFSTKRYRKGTNERQRNISPLLIVSTRTESVENQDSDYSTVGMLRLPKLYDVISLKSQREKNN